MDREIAQQSAFSLRVIQALEEFCLETATASAWFGPVADVLRRLDRRIRHERRVRRGRRPKARRRY